MTAPLFRLEGIRFGFAGRPLLDGVTFTLRAGERVALLGDNGAGKTTLFHLMVGLLKPQAGRIVAFGAERLSEADFHEVRARAGLLFQDPDDQLFCPTVAEDIAFGPLNLGCSRAEARRRVAATLAQVGLSGFEDRVTHKLSGGQKRLVSLAAVLAMEPQVLLLDEPSNALDQGARARLIDSLAGLPQAMVIVSHDPDLVERLATRSVFLKDGRLAGEEDIMGHSHEHKHDHAHPHTHVHTHEHAHGALVHVHAHAHTHAHEHLHQHRHPHEHGDDQGHGHSHEDAKHAWKPHEHQHSPEDLPDHDHTH
jgi:cobalt/nickel transport system ATP-binding protein